MKRNKIILMICFTVLLCFAVFSAEAQDQTSSIGIQISTAAAKTGEDVTLSVSLTENPGVSYLSLKFTYDTAKLSFEGFDDVVESAEFSGKWEKNAAEAAANWNNGRANSTYTGEVLKLKFKALAEGEAEVTAALGDADGALQYEEGTDGKNLTPEFTQGKVTITEPVTSEKIGIQISTATVKPGEDVTLSVSLTENPGVSYLSLKFTYDTAKLSFEGFDDVVESAEFSGKWEKNAAEAAANWNNGRANSTYTGEVLKLKFKALAEGEAEVTAALGDADGALQYEEGTDGKNLTPEFTQGKVTITEPVTSEKIGIQISTATVKPGEDVTLSVSLTENPGVSYLSLKFTYDTAKLSFEGFDDVVESAEFSGKWEKNAAEAAANWNNGRTNSTYTGEVLKLKFKALAEGEAEVTAALGDADGALQYEEGTDGKNLTPEFTQGKVTIVPPVLPETIVLNPKTASIGVGQDLAVSATILPDNADDLGIIWTSSDPSIATVAQSKGKSVVMGVVTGVSEGVVTITARSSANEALLDTCVVTVIQSPVVIPTSIVLDPASASIKVGEEISIIAIVTPDEAENKTVTWVSNNPSVAVVDQNGNVTGVAEGTVTITVISNADPTVTAQIMVTVTAQVGPQPPVPVLPTSIVLNPSGSASVESGKTLHLTATVLPANAADKSVRWQSSDPTVATVDASGRVTGVNKGTAAIIVTSNANPDVSARIIVNVTEPVNPPQPQPPFWHFDIIGQPLPRTGFTSLRPQALPEMPLNLSYQPLHRTLEIPSLSVAADIVEIPNENGEYPITWLGDKVGLLEGFALPGEGYTVLTGHNHLNTTEAGPFALLSSMEEGDRIFVRDSKYNLKTYVVYANEKVSETDYEAVESIAVKYEGSLTMITCEDERIEGGYASRRIVAARPY